MQDDMQGYWMLDIEECGTGVSPVTFFLISQISNHRRDAYVTFYNPNPSYTSLPFQYILNLQPYLRIRIVGKLLKYRKGVDTYR